MSQNQSSREATATLAGGCFWCLEAVYDQLEGVSNVKSGYAGGHKPNPTYEEVCTGSTGHAEVVTLTYDPAKVSYRDLLRIFFTVHDPTTKDRQGNDIGTQYRSAIYYTDDEQRTAAEEIMEEVRQQALYPAPLVTELEPLEELYPAETYHDDYYERNPNQGYCAAVIAPKVAKFRKQYFDRLKRAPAGA